MFAYADDLAVVGTSKKTLKQSIKITEKWADDNKMMINKKNMGLSYIKQKESDPKR